MVKRNAAKSSILAINKSNGSTITSTVDIGQEFVTYFTSLLSTEVQTLPVDNDVFEWGPKLCIELALELCRAVTPLEVKQAIFHISDNKAPGPDGYSACFFKRAWDVVGDQVCTAVMDFFRSGRLLRQLNHSIIALVPKSDTPPCLRTTGPSLAATSSTRPSRKLLQISLPLPWSTLSTAAKRPLLGDGA
ncbi:UNVERIFIED_CONTAM: hypothetical protein Slati_3971200 [Sesamum latifolium]|uniref:Reverse transcriptase n=1 Tax=Sesamum latifolium TaxID=2727402 RepID=A0AAW2TNT7_9LAMI